ncbi:hypothetical protein ACFTZB_36270 [Rhodococcus sp. NPDC057014]|uniref:hypothetical protein n=1 Tax=Rhodococcus sp. NPDC057014 TaxID=3346000 RepID=UPI003641B350
MTLPARPRSAAPGHAMSTATIKAHLTAMFAEHDTPPRPEHDGPEPCGTPPSGRTDITHHPYTPFITVTHPSTGRDV